MSRDREKRRGSYFFWSDWRGSEVAGLTYAAKGLWIDMLAVMADRTPQGVIDGDLESLAEALGYVGPMAQCWADQYKSLIQELESKRVFSRGCDIDERLPGDAIVNRRMYREQAKREDISEERSRAARIRWDREKGLPEGAVSVDQVRAELASGACKTDAKSCKRDANAMQNKIDDSPENKGDYEKLDDLERCKKMLIPNPTYPNPTQPNPKKEQGEAMQIGAALALQAPIDGKAVYADILAVTRDRDKARARWWNGVVNAFRRAQALDLLQEQVEVVRRKAGDLKAPSRYLAKRVLTLARETGIKVPDLPGGSDE